MHEYIKPLIYCGTVIVMITLIACSPGPHHPNPDAQTSEPPTSPFLVHDRMEMREVIYDAGRSSSDEKYILVRVDGVEYLVVRDYYNDAIGIIRHEKKAND